MSSFTKQVGEDKYYCLDDYFGKRKYGYIKMNKEQRESESPWELCSTKGVKVLTEEEFINITK